MALTVDDREDIVLVSGARLQNGKSLLWDVKFEVEVLAVVSSSPSERFPSQEFKVKFIAGSLTEKGVSRDDFHH